MKHTLNELFEEFYKECRYSRKLRDETLKGYRSVFDLLMKLMPNLTLRNLSSSSMSDFFEILDERKKAASQGDEKTGVKISTIATYRSKLNSFFKWLKNRGHIAKNPFDGMDYPHPEYEDKKYLDGKNVEKIITAVVVYSWASFLIQKRNLLFIYLAFGCGLRKGELLNLKIIDINHDKQWLNVDGGTSKSKVSRLVPLNSEVYSRLQDYLEERNKIKPQLTTPYLFVSSRGDRRFTSHGFKHLMYKLNEISRVKFHIHQLRHTFGVNHAAFDTNIGKLKQLMGHKDIRMTQSYLRCIPTSSMEGDAEKIVLNKLV